MLFLIIKVLKKETTAAVGVIKIVYTGTPTLAKDALTPLPLQKRSSSNSKDAINSKNDSSNKDIGNSKDASNSRGASNSIKISKAKSCGVI
jgi:hypothetical protein